MWLTIGRTARLFVPSTGAWNEIAWYLYSGNLGLAHEADTLSEAMERLKEDARFQFVFAGGGSLRQPLEARCREMGVFSVEFRSYTQREKLGESLGNG